MSWADFVNGSFEACGGLFILLSILQVLKDKAVHGVNWIHPAFFSAWGFWNLYYYPSLGQWISFWGGVGVVTMNTIWVVLLIKYRRR